MPYFPPAPLPITYLDARPSASQAVDITHLQALVEVPSPGAPVVQHEALPNPSKAEIIQDLKIKKLKLQIQYYEMKLQERNQEE